MTCSSPTLNRLARYWTGSRAASSRSSSSKSATSLRDVQPGQRVLQHAHHGREQQDMNIIAIVEYSRCNGRTICQTAANL